MIKSDNWILEMGKELISPFHNKKIRKANDVGVISFGTGHAGYDLTLSSQTSYLFYNKYSMYGTQSVVDPKRFEERFTKEITVNQSSNGEFFLLPKKSSMLGGVNETLYMPGNIIGLAWGKSTYSRCNVNVYCQPVEPGWSGQLSILVVNYNDRPAKVYANEGICQIVFFELDQPVKNEYGNGKYQNQTGITFSEV